MQLIPLPRKCGGSRKEAWRPRERYADSLEQHRALSKEEHSADRHGICSFNLHVSEKNQTFCDYGSLGGSDNDSRRLHGPCVRCRWRPRSKTTAKASAISLSENLPWSEVFLPTENRKTCEAVELGPDEAVMI